MNKIDNNNLTKIVIDARDGADGAFKKLYSETIKFSYGVASVLLRNKEDIEDVLQNSYMYVAKYIGDLKNPESFESWLGTIVRHECLKHIEKKRKFSDIFAGVKRTKEIQMLSDEHIPYDLIERKEVNEAVRRIVDKLPDDKRVCIVLYYFERKSLSEISEIIGIPEGTVKSRLHSGRKFIEREFEKIKGKDETFYGVSIIPLVAAFFAYQVSKITVPASIAEGAAVCVSVAEITAASTLAASSATAVSTAGATSVAAGSATATAGVAVSTKVAAVVVATAVATGGGAATVSYINNRSELSTTAVQTTTEEYTTAALIYDETIPASDSTISTVVNTSTTTEGNITVFTTREKTTVLTTVETSSVTTKKTTRAEKTTGVGTTQSATTMVRTTVAETTAQKETTTESTTVTESETTTAKPTETRRETTTSEPVTDVSDVYSVSNGVLAEYTGEGSTVSVPSNVGGEEINAIGSGAFAGNTSMISLSLPSSVTRIGQEAFSDCTSLKDVTLPSSLKSIGIGAFCGCYELSVVTVPSGVTSIGDDAFADCSSLTSVTIPSSVTSIGDNAFGRCDNLTIKCSEDSVAYDYAVENSINYELV